MSDALTALLLGVVEGLTEFIPVSSTGHLLLLGHFLGFESTGRMFEVVIQLGAILALVVVYLTKLRWLVTGIGHDRDAQRFALSVLLAFLPAAALGVAMHDVIKTVFFETPRLIAWMLILGGFVLLAVDRWHPAPRHDQASRLPLGTSFGIGLFQCLALVPGVSRSGATITGALLLGVDRRAAAEFSFFLSLPTMLGAVTYDLLSGGAALDRADVWLIAIGFGAAFLLGLLVVRWLLDFVSRRGFGVFAWWRILVGTAALIALSQVN